MAQHREWQPEKRQGQKILARIREAVVGSARAATNDPFVYRLGLQIFILARRVRFPYGSPLTLRSAASGAMATPEPQTLPPTP